MFIKVMQPLHLFTNKKLWWKIYFDKKTENASWEFHVSYPLALQIREHKLKSYVSKGLFHKIDKGSFFVYEFLWPSKNVLFTNIYFHKLDKNNFSFTSIFVN